MHSGSIRTCPRLIASTVALKHIPAAFKPKSVVLLELDELSLVRSQEDTRHEAGDSELLDDF